MHFFTSPVWDHFENFRPCAFILILVCLEPEKLSFSESYFLGLAEIFVSNPVSTIVNVIVISCRSFGLTQASFNAMLNISIYCDTETECLSNKAVKNPSTKITNSNRREPCTTMFPVLL